MNLRQPLREATASIDGCPSEEQIEMALIHGSPPESPIWPHILFCSSCSPMVSKVCEEVDIILGALVATQARKGSDECSAVRNTAAPAIRITRQPSRHNQLR